MIAIQGIHKLISLSAVINTVDLMCSHIWTDTDNNRAGMLPFVFDNSFGFAFLLKSPVLHLECHWLIASFPLKIFSMWNNPDYSFCLGCRFEQYVDYALDVPMYFVYRNKKYIDCTGMSFRVYFYPWCPFTSVVVYCKGFIFF